MISTEATVTLKAFVTVRILSRIIGTEDVLDMARNQCIRVCAN